MTYERSHDITWSLSMQAHMFEVYVTYCENKPMSESFLWTFHHNGGTFFEVSHQPLNPCRLSQPG